MKSNNKISLREIDMKKFNSIDVNKTQILAPSVLNPIKQKNTTKSKEMLMKIYSAEKIAYPNQNRESIF
jgi:hypothetical protein